MSMSMSTFQVSDRKAPSREAADSTCVFGSPRRVVHWLIPGARWPSDTALGEIPRAEVDAWTALEPDLLAHVMTIGAALVRAFAAPRAGLVVAGFEVPHAHVRVFP